LKRDFSFLLALVEIPRWIDCILFNWVFFLLFLFSFTFFSLFFLHVLCRHFATCYVLHAFLYTTLVCMYKLSVLQFYLSHCKSLFFFLKHSAFRFLAGYFKLLHTLFPGWTQYNINIIIYQKLYYAHPLDAVTLSGILKAKQKLGVTFNFDKQDVIDLTKFSKMTMCRASNSEK
jgi:hypothetical protein